MLSYPYNTKTVALPGDCEVAYIDEGKGKQTLLFIHGLANYALVWKKNIDELKAHYRCIAIDLPGNGLSDRNEHPFGMQFFSECVYHFIQALGLKNVCLVGHSMGGQVAMTTVINHPQCASAMVLCAPAGFEQFSGMEKTMYYSALQMFDFIASDEQSLRTTIENSFYRRQPQVEVMIKELVSLMKTYKPHYYKKMIEACIKSMLEDTVYNRLNLITTPALVLFGSNDALIPNKLIHHTTTEKLATDAVKQMPGAILKMIHACGHFVQWEQAEEVDRRIKEFMPNA